MVKCGVLCYTFVGYMCGLGFVFGKLITFGAPVLPALINYGKVEISIRKSKRNAKLEARSASFYVIVLELQHRRPLK